MSHEKAREYVDANEAADTTLAEFLHANIEVRTALGTPAFWRVVARVARSWESAGKPCGACAVTDEYIDNHLVGDAYAHTCGRRP